MYRCVVNIRVAQQSPGVFDPFLAADLCAALVAGQVQHQVLWQSGQVPKPGIRPAEILDA
jgi:hypothetical protein